MKLRGCHIVLSFLVALAFLAASVTFYILGLCYPLMSTKYQVLGFQIRSQEVTLFDSVRMFWESSDYLIAGIILVFTFIFPILKYIELALRLATILLLDKKTGKVFIVK